MILKYFSNWWNAKNLTRFILYDYPKYKKIRKKDFIFPSIGTPTKNQDFQIVINATRNFN